MEQNFDYVIVGAGLAGVSAIDGIREYDPQGTILVIGLEKSLPYHRPPLSKDLWWGTKSEDDVYIRDRDFYTASGVTLLPGTLAVDLDTTGKTVSDAAGNRYGYGKLLLATGGEPRTLPLPGADLEGVYYYRYLSDYEALRGIAVSGARITMIGGGFIGSEVAASLAQKGCRLTMVYPEAYLCARVLPDSLGRELQEEFWRQGIRILNGDRPESFTRYGRKGVITRTHNGHDIEADAVVVGIGIVPSTKLAEDAGIIVDRGIVVNEFQQTSDPSVFAAGDVAVFPSLPLGKDMRVEHWEHSLMHGRQAGRNMAGARQPYDYLPSYFTTMFDFNCQAVGELSSDMQTIPEWEVENRRGTVYYVRDGVVNGVLLCNSKEDIDRMRELVRIRVPADLVRGAAV